jgi:enamine deaminase RidA (YjgF/YER057c/UK114 family)
MSPPLQKPQSWAIRGFPARAFLGVASLIRGAHFEVAGIAVKRTKK